MAGAQEGVLRVSYPPSTFEGVVYPVFKHHHDFVVVFPRRVEAKVDVEGVQKFVLVIDV